MQIKAYKSHKITKNNNLFKIVDDCIRKIEENSIFVVTSKIISLCEGSVVEKNRVSSKEELIERSADAYLKHYQLAIKNNILTPFAGVDESNGGGDYILHPKNIQESAVSLWRYLRHRDKLQKLGILITDSHVIPMRRGVTGIGLGWCGFKALSDYRGKLDCFGAPLRITIASNLDALAAAAVFCMGEGNEQTPFAIITDICKIEFQSEPPTEVEVQELSIPMEEDLYAPLIKNAEWIFR